MNLINHQPLCRHYACVALLASLLAACGSDSPSPTPPARTPPPAFVAETVVIDLGTHGGKITLVSTQAGGWTRNGTAITSGETVQGENGADYKLTLSGGQWSAQFVTPDPVSVALGTSGDAVALQALEDGSFQLNGTPVTDGQVRLASNGSQYRFTMSESGTWTAEFVPPDPIQVRLGASGMSLSIRVVGHRRYELDGTPITSGHSWTADNGHVYRLDLAEDGTWTAVFVSSPPVSVPLGSSGDTVSIQENDDGTYSLGGEQLFSGKEVTAGNGNRYRLALRTGRVWEAVFIKPAPATVALGTSGDTVEVQALEDGSYELDGEPLASGQVVTGGNGNRYRFLLQSGGRWTAEYVPPDPTVVALGSSGSFVRIEIREDQTYLLDGQPLTSGQVRTVQNRRYRFQRAPNGEWTAVYVPETVEVQLGFHGGSLTLTRLENGSYRSESREIETGDTVTGTNNHQYRLTLGANGWTAEPLPLSITIMLPGNAGSIVVSQFEDGTYSYNDNRIANGETVTVNGVTYVLTLSGTEGTARRQSVAPPDPVKPPTPPAGDITSDTIETYVGVRPRLRDDNTMLEINDEKYSFADIFPEGLIERDKTFVEDVRDEIETLLGQVELLVDLYDGDTSIADELEKRWDSVRDQLNILFPGQGRRLLDTDMPKRTGRSTIDTDEVVQTIKDTLAALDSASDFEDAVDDDVFRDDVTLDQDDIDDVFSTSKSIEIMGFGSTKNTRFGAYSRRERSRVTSSLAFASGEGGLGAFAYSPLERARTAHLPRGGQALYSGGTVAASGQSDQEIYRGVLELTLRFNSRQVSGLISELEDNRGNPWVYSASEVDTISLPNATLHSTDGSFESAANARGYLDYLTSFGSRRSQNINGEFEGRFLSTGTNAAEAAIGTWKITQGSGTSLTGAFGVEYDSTEEPRLPAATTPDDETARTSLIAAPDSNGDIAIAARDADGDRIELSAEDLYNDGTATIAGSRLFALATDVIEKQLKILQLFIDLDDNSADGRNGIWENVNEALSDHVFGPSHTTPLGSAYPAGRSQRVRDENAVEMLQDAKAALGSADRFQASLSDDGVFTGLLGSKSGLDRYDFDEIHDALASNVRVEFGHTNYTRFGAWRKSEKAYATSDSQRNLASREDPDVFAYSSLEQAVYRASDQLFPANSTATYRGQTRAVDRESKDPVFYDGDITVTVEWGSSVNRSSVYAVIEDLARSSTGVPFTYNGLDVDQIVISGVSASTDSNRRVGFSSSSPAVRIRYESVARRDATVSGTRSHVGKFVGLSLTGPVGVIGTWELGDVKGAYGADFAP